MQARLALAQGARYSCTSPCWTRVGAGMRRTAGTHVVRTPEEITSAVERLTSPGALTA